MKRAVSTPLRSTDWSFSQRKSLVTAARSPDCAARVDVTVREKGRCTLFLLIFYNCMCSMGVPLGSSIDLLGFGRSVVSRE
jgi:hypothetical protein